MDAWHDPRRNLVSARAEFLLDAYRKAWRMADAARKNPHSDGVGGSVPYDAFLHLRRRATVPRWWPSAQEHQTDANGALGHPARRNPPSEGEAA